MVSMGVRRFIGFCFAVIILLGQGSCNRPSADHATIGHLSDVTKNFKNFWTYFSEHIKLSEDFIGLDTNKKEISRPDFLKLLSTGKYMPLKLESDSLSYYALYKIAPSIQKDISSTLKAMGITEYHHFKMEGKLLDHFDFRDINGQVYNSKTFKGKVVAIKLWFIKCQKCIEEMPSLHVLIGNRKDVTFISLATDSDKDLKEFVQKNKITIPVIGDQKKYIMSDLGINIFPTYIIMNTDGRIAKVVNSYEELEMYLNKKFPKA